MRFSALCCSTLAILLLLSPAIVRAEAEEEAVRVYKNVQGSVVSLNNAECSGTGIILDAKGTILTNAHLAVSPMPFECSLDVIEAGKKKQITFKKVEVVGFDPRLDLALLRIDPAEQHVTLKPVVINRKKADVGQKIYAIGNPAAGGQILTKTITSGMIGAVDREVDGDPYYQIDAAINPGNSGGPLCDRNGQVLGLITFRSEPVDAGETQGLRREEQRQIQAGSPDGRIQRGPKVPATLHDQGVCRPDRARRRPAAPRGQGSHPAETRGAPGPLQERQPEIARDKTWLNSPSRCETTSA